MWIICRSHGPQLRYLPQNHSGVSFLAIRATVGSCAPKNPFASSAKSPHQPRMNPTFGAGRRGDLRPTPQPWTIALAMAVAAAAGLSAAPASWPQFRGTRCDNVFAGQHAPKEFGPDKNVFWKAEISSGQSTPCIVGDRIYLTGFDGDKTLETLAIKRADGSVAWRRTITPEKLEPYFVKLGSPAASTCASEGRRVVSYFGSFGLICHDLAGTEQWRVALPLPQTKDGFGSGTSPIVHDGLVYLLRDEDGPGKGLYAFDLKSGKQVWRRDRDGFRVSFGTPLIWDGNLVALGDLRVKAYDPKTGADRWSVRGLAAYPCTSPTPGADGNLYIATWSNGSSNERNMPAWPEFLAMMDKDKDGKLSKADSEGTFMADFFVLFDKNKNGFIDPEEWEDSLSYMARGKNAVVSIKPGGKGDITDTHVRWSNDKGAPYVASPLVHDGRVYLIKDGGLLTIYEAATGKVLADKERIGVPGDYYASPVAVGDKILIAAQSGVVVTLKPGDKPEVLSKTDFGEPIAATPVVADDTLYIRSGRHLWAFREK